MERFDDGDSVCLEALEALEAEELVAADREEASAERRRIERRRYAQYLRNIERNPWLKIQDVIGEARRWPSFIREAFFDRNFNDHRRMIVVNFCFLNGVGKMFVHEVLEFTLGPRHYTRDRREQVSARFRYLLDRRHGDTRRARVYSYNLVLRRLLYLNGDPYPRGRT